MQEERQLFPFRNITGQVFRYAVNLFIVLLIGIILGYVWNYYHYKPFVDELASIKDEVKHNKEEISKLQDMLQPVVDICDIIAGYNPGLTSKERFEIGRAVLYYSNLRNLDPLLVTSLIIVESHGNAYALSSKGAVGLMQIMPYVAEGLGFDEDLFSIDANIKLGTFILADNIRRWGFHNGIQRYFWGTGAADDRYISKVLKVMEGFKG